MEGTPWTLEALVQAAHQVVQQQQSGTSAREGETSPEKTRADVKMLVVKDIRVCSVRVSSMALLDSGATHFLRPASTRQEWEEAEEVRVQLAGTHTLLMRMTSTGTLLMPYGNKREHAREGQEGSGQTIVPIGQLVHTLGYSLHWTPTSCYLQDSNGIETVLKVKSGCPQLQEVEALSLIARIEERKKEHLENETLVLQDKVEVASRLMEKTWEDHLRVYAQNGKMGDGLRALRDAPFLDDLPCECLCGLVPADVEDTGWEILKELSFLNRSQRRRLLLAKRWVVHLFAGEPGHWEVFKLDQHGTVVLELDVHRCRGQDIYRPEVWRALVWAARMGKVDVVMGGPPGRQRGSFGHNGVLPDDLRPLSAITRMVWLHAVSEAGRLVNGPTCEKRRPVGFVVEHPEHEVEVIAHPSGTCFKPDSIWTTSIWKSYSEVGGLRMASFDQGMMGSNTRNPTTLGTNVDHLLSLHELRQPEGEEVAAGGAPPHVWSPGMVRAVVIGLTFWDRGRHQYPMVRAMTPEQWKAHVDSNHEHYRRDCVTCVLARGTGQRHMRVHHPDSYVLTIDLAGPVKPGLDPTSKGKMGKGLKYMVIAKYLVPKEFIKGRTSKEPPDDHGQGTPSKPSEEEKKLEDELFGDSKELMEQSSKPPPHGEGQVRDVEQVHNVENSGCGGGELDIDLFGDSEELKQSSTPPPRDGSFLVEHVPAEPGPFDREHVPAEPGPVQGGSIEPQMDQDPLEDVDIEDYDPSFAGDSGEEEADQEGPQPDHSRNMVMSTGDCVPPEHTYLVFGMGIPNNLATTVKTAVQDIILYLRGHGFPVYRFHSDKGECFNHNFRGWLRDQGIRATWSEPGVPQGNGHAESTVRWAKDRVRTLLYGAALPVRLWPMALETAAAQQRARVLGWKSMLAAPFGAKVHIRKKPFDAKGPRRRELALESKWSQGHYMGLSSLLQRGHVVYLPSTSSQAETFLHTGHVRPGLVDPGPPAEEWKVDDKPRRRLKAKTSYDRVEMKRVNLTREEQVTMATTTASQMLEVWDHEDARELVVTLAEKGFFDELKFGVFRHGGTVGWMTGLEQYPDLSRLLARLVLEVEPTATFTSIWVSHNSQRPLHQDLNNDEWSYNYAIPLQCPLEGGELWTELRPGDQVCGPISVTTPSGSKQVYGQEHPLQLGKCIRFSPRRLHEVLDWKGSRTMLIAYTPQCLGKLNYKDIKILDAHGFPPPLSQLPEAFGGEPRPYLAKANVEKELSPPPQGKQQHDGLTEVLQDEEEWDIYLDLEDGEVRFGGEFGLATEVEQVAMRKTEVTYTPNVERILQELETPLEVTYTVDPREVLGHLSLWEAAIRKEVSGIEVAIQRLLPDTPERGAWLSTPGIQRLPTKFVFTVKPNDKAVLSDRNTWWKRKARLVVCGNYAQEDGSNLYAESAPAEAVRAGLILSCRKGWQVSILDVVAAFLKTPIGRKATDPKIVVAPPKLLERLQMTTPLELWGLIRALYGLRQSPALWSDFRDDMIAQMKLPDGLKFVQGRTVRCWWSILDSAGSIVGVMIVYVDDFMICGSGPVVAAVSGVIRSLWETSELTTLSPTTPARFLGMELSMVSGEQGVIYVSQHGYIQELLRHHELPSTRLDKVPLSKELASFNVEDNDIPPDDYMVHRAQQITGEVLWVSQRSRPDLSYTSALMSTLTTRAPYRVVDVGLKTLSYLRRTSRYQLRISWTEAPLTMFCDAAYAPQSERSHAGWLVTYGQVPLVWRSSRQQMITLSTAEAELLALTDGAIALKGVECLLADLGEQITARELATDSSAALGISQGASSWRTRHLRIRAGWLVEQVQFGLMTTRHCPGLHQPADLLTKPLSSQRLRALLQLWKIGEQEQPAAQPVVSRLSIASSRITVALVCCLLMMTVEASSTEPESSVKVDADMLTVFMALVMLLGLIMIWEGCKWLFWEVMLEWAPGSRSRKLRRLEKLREATAKAIHEELTRMDSSTLTTRSRSAATSQSTTERQGRTARRTMEQTLQGVPDSDVQQSSSSTTTMPTEVEQLLRKRAPAMSASPRLQTDADQPTRRRAPAMSTSPRLPTEAEDSLRRRAPAMSSPPRLHDGAEESSDMWILMSEENNEDEGGGEYLRVCTDTASLMRCEELREALRLRGLPTTGLKSDLAARLGHDMWSKRNSKDAPTAKQYKYLLWLWRTKDLGGRVLLMNSHLDTRVAASRTIHAWKNR